MALCLAQAHAAQHPATQPLSAVGMLEAKMRTPTPGLTSTACPATPPLHPLPPAGMSPAGRPVRLQGRTAAQTAQTPLWLRRRGSRHRGPTLYRWGQVQHVSVPRRPFFLTEARAIGGNPLAATWGPHKWLQTLLGVAGASGPVADFCQGQGGREGRKAPGAYPIQCKIRGKTSRHSTSLRLCVWS